MVTVRRWYVYLVCTISLQAVAWALINLLRNLLQTTGLPDPSSIAFQIAVLIVGLPLFLAHWLWVQRMARTESDERESDVRRLYLYFNKAAFLSPMVAQIYYLISEIINARVGPAVGRPELHHILPIIVLGILWLYHFQILRIEMKERPLLEISGVFRRLYILSFSLAGLIVVWSASVDLLRWSVQSIIPQNQDIPLMGDILRSMAVILTGLPLWLIFWRRAQNLYQRGGPEESFSALRKFYLYGIVFTGAMTAVGASVLLLTMLNRLLLGLDVSGFQTGDFLSLILVSGVIWAYHTYVLQTDGQKTEEAPRQSGIRRLYVYLISAIGLATFLGGVSVILIVFIRWLGSGIFGDELREMLAVSTAGLIAGLPVWLIPWIPAQKRASEPGPSGEDERRSVVRKIYLYFFLFVATVLFLSSLIFIVYRLVGTALGEASPTFTELGQAISLTIIGVFVWLYHIVLIRQDNSLLKADRSKRVMSLRVAIVVESQQGREFIDNLQREVPGLHVDVIEVKEPVAVASPEDAGPAIDEMNARLEQNEVVIAPWPVLLDSQVGAAMAANPIRKLLLPLPEPGWELVGVDYPGQADLVKRTALALHQIMDGEPIRPHKQLGVAAIVGITLGVFFMLLIGVPLVISAIIEFF
jgi:hypothetical protein